MHPDPGDREAATDAAASAGPSGPGADPAGATAVPDADPAETAGAPEADPAVPPAGPGPGDEGPSGEEDGAEPALPPWPPGTPAPGEGPLLVLRPSLLAGLDLLGKAVAAAALLVVPVLVGVLLQGGRPGLAALVAAVVGLRLLDMTYALLAALVPVVQLAFTRYVVDEEGIRVHVQLFTRSERTVRWDKVTLLRHRRTLVDRMFRIDRLDVVAYGERGTTLNLVGLRQAPHLRDLVARRMREHASVGGVLGED